MSLIVELQTEIKARHEIEGFMDRFTNTCLRAIDPGLNDLIFFKADMTGEKFNKPKYADGTPNPHWPRDRDNAIDPPRDKDERQDFFHRVKQGHLREWLDRVRDGEFDGSKVVTPKQEDSPVQDAVQDVTDLDMSMDEKPEEPITEGVEISKEKPESVLDEVDDLVEDNATKGTPPPQKMARVLKDVSNSTGASLLRALDDYLASTDSPPEDNPKVDAILGDFQTAILRLGKEVNAMKDQIDTLSRAQEEQLNRQNAQSEVIETLKEKLVSSLRKVPELIKEEILKKFSA